MSQTIAGGAFMNRDTWILLLAISYILPSSTVAADGYNILELRDEESRASPPFSIVDIASHPGGLRLFLSTANPDVIASLLTSGALETQLSDHNTETASPVSLSLGKAVWCGEDSDPIYLGYQEALPACGGQPPAKIEYFFDAAATLGSSRDLAIGQDPDFLWLVEEQ
jgi:hypothetical protein